MIDIDLGAERECLGRFLRVGIEVDVIKLLERCFIVNLECEDSFTIFLKYEKLPDYYFDCGMLGHTNKECPSETPNQPYDPKVKAKYVDWLKVLLPSKSKRPGPPQTQTQSQSN